MATVTIEIDTSKKTSKVSVNGKKVENVREVFVSSEDGPMGFHVEIVQREDMDDMRKHVRLVADDQGEIVADSNLANRLDISTYLQQKWNL